MISDTQVFGALATSTVFISRYFYFKSVYRDGARPHAFSWLIWGCISAVGFAAQVAEGAGPGAWARGFSCATCFILVVIGWQRGDRGYTPGDWITLAVSLFAIPLWILTRTPIYSVILVSLIDTIGFVPTIRKAWTRPFEEPAAGYGWFSIGALLSLAAIENYTPSTWLYPAVMVFTNGAMTAFLLLRRKRKTVIAQN